MSVLRYCCFRWLVYDRALVFEPSRPLACIMMLVWLIYVVELCCDIFPWVPDLDRTRLLVWLVYDWIRGVTSWYQSRLPVGIPLPHSLAEVESRHCKTFTNMVVRLTVPRRHWVVVGSFIPRLYSGTLISLLFGLNEFANSKIRISWSHPPGEPLTAEDRLLHQKIPKILSDVLSRLCARRFCNSLSSIYPYG